MEPAGARGDDALDPMMMSSDVQLVVAVGSGFDR